MTTEVVELPEETPIDWSTRPDIHYRVDGQIIVRPEGWRPVPENAVPLSEAETAALYTKSYDDQMRQLRLERDTRMKQSDWTQLPDSPLLGNADWVAYRQALRDFPAAVEALESPDWTALPWPVPPAA